jgi:hypothetical protein
LTGFQLQYLLLQQFFVGKTSPDTTLLTPVIVFFENVHFREFMELSSLLPHVKANSKVSDPKPDMEPLYSLIDDADKVKKFQELNE